jgi:hypothetical protein
MSAIALRENPGETIVTDSCTSNGLATFVQQLGGKHFRWGRLRRQRAGWAEWGIVGPAGATHPYCLPASACVSLLSGCVCLLLPSHPAVPYPTAWHNTAMPGHTYFPTFPLPGTSLPHIQTDICLPLCCCRYKKGYKNIINKGIELNEAGVPCPLMMETSGHGAMRVRRCCYHRAGRRLCGLG